MTNKESNIKPKYVNIAVDDSGKETINYEDAPELPGSVPKCRPYVNVVPLEVSDEKYCSTSPQKELVVSGAKYQSQSPKKTQERSLSGNSPDKSPLRRHLSETGSRSSRKGPLTEARDGVTVPGFLIDVSDSSPISTEQAIANAKLRVLIPQGAATGKGCEKCEDLMELLATWQIGAGSLTRNYSRILALLMRTRDSAMALECRLNEQTRASPSSPVTTAGSSTTSASVSNMAREARRTGLPSADNAVPGATPLRAPSRIPKNRQSMYVNTSGMGFAAAGIREHDLAENMYPSREDSTSSTPSPSPVMVNSATYAKDLKDLNTHLWDAIDLCQQLAAACFKNTHLSKPPSKGGDNKTPSHSNPSSSPPSQSSDPLSRSTPSSGFVRKHSAGMTGPASNYKPSLQAITEMRGSGSLKKKKRQRTLERVPSAPSLECSTEIVSSSNDGETHSDSESDFVTVTAEEIPDSVTKATIVSTKKEKGTSQGVTKKGVPEIERVTTEADESSQESDDTAANSIEVEGGTPPTADSSAGLKSESPNHAMPEPYESSSEDQTSVMTSMSLPSDKDMMVNERADSVLSSASTYTDSDVKYVMSKIASLEEERYGLLETIDQLHTENSTVSLYSTVP